MDKLDRPFSLPAANRALTTLSVIPLERTFRDVAASGGGVPSTEPALLRVFRRKSSSSVVGAPSSDDSTSSNGSTGDQPSELFAGPGDGEYCAEVLESDGRLKNSLGVRCSMLVAECGEIIRTVFFAGLTTSDGHDQQRF